MVLRETRPRLALLFVASGVTGALAPAASASADPAAALIGPGSAYVDDRTAVECVQAGLGIVVDGEFGQQTYDAIRAFQQDQGLTVDGIVGPLTGDRLLESMSSGSLRSYCYPLIPTTWTAQPV